MARRTSSTAAPASTPASRPATAPTWSSTLAAARRRRANKLASTASYHRAFSQKLPGDRPGLCSDDTWNLRMQRHPGGWGIAVSPGRARPATTPGRRLQLSQRGLASPPLKQPCGQFRVCCRRPQWSEPPPTTSSTSSTPASRPTMQLAAVGVCEVWERRQADRNDSNHPQWRRRHEILATAARTSPRYRRQ